MNYIVLYILLTTVAFCDSVVTMNQQSYSLDDFYKLYGKKEWDSSPANQKQDLINDFINRKLGALEATEIGLQNKPDIAKRLHNRNQIALVNITYEELVARPLVSQESLNKTRQYIIEERLLNHILIGHSNSRTQTPPDRTVDEAFLLAQKISKELNEGANFADYAIKYSDDPTVLQNEGKLDWITWGRTIADFQNEAFMLEVGQYSRPVLTDFGYHIIFCEDIRPSEYASFTKEELEDVVYIVSRNEISQNLRGAAEKYDASQFDKYGIKYNNQALDLILKNIVQQTNKNKISGQYKIDLIKLFENLEKIGVVIMIDNKGYGIKWFAEQLKMIPSGQHPQIMDLKSLQQGFDLIVLKYLAVQEGYKNNIHNHKSYINEKNKLYESLLYDQYLRWLVNNAEQPDSSDIENYYLENKNQKYLEDEKVSVREIKVLNKELADSLFLELKHGASFIEIAEKYSKTNPTSGGKIPPFTKGKYNEMGQAAFTLGVGEISKVITNLDRTYSIIRIEEVIEPEYIPLIKVYNRIESVLKRNNQKTAKDEGLKNLREKYNVKINEKIYSD